ncbi:MAG TPA: helix-turn-helix transcriptional regulator [Aldersonia sp.]
MRKTKGITQAEVARRIGRDPAVVSNFERLGSDPHLSTIRRYARAIDARVTHAVVSVSDTSSDGGVKMGRLA